MNQSQLFRHALSPVRVAGHVLKNRVVSAPSSMHTAQNGEPYPSEKGIGFFEARAKAGCGLVTCANVSIGPKVDDGLHAGWDVTVPNHMNRLCDLAERIHLYGAKCTMELIGVFPDGYTVSDGCSIMGSPPIGREIPKAVMLDFLNNYAAAARGIKQAGFDGVMLHFGHAIPVAQFLSPLTNRRTDEYGGSFENRVRYPLEILKAVRTAVGPDLIIDVRISVDEFEPGGIDSEEGVRIAEAFSPYADIIQGSCGMHNPDWMTWTHPCGFLPPLPNVKFAEALKSSGRVSSFVTAIGGIGSLADAEAIIADGRADFVMAARSFIADIDWIKKDIEGRHEDVVPCIKCMRCHDSDNYEQHMQCAVNPRVGLEQAIDAFPRAQEGKRVAVVGGGPAGITAALMAAERGHDVTLYERTDSLGGALKFSDYVAIKYPIKEYKDFLVRQIEKSPVRVHLNTEATPETLAGYDAIVAAAGAEPATPPVDGMERASFATDIYGRESSLGERITIIGGGQVGCETGYHLASLDRKVTILEMRDGIAPDASKTHRDELLVELAKEPNLTILTGAAVKSIAPDAGVTYEKGGEERTLAADDVILAVGMKPRRGLADSLIDSGVTFAEAGDCMRARTIEWAVKEGFYAALNV
jgi:2,4-dienoyl-CoA reductase-like NADH-dependent reductase (Old Yellow Enzyme family)/thioredoxin reductase